MSSQEQARSRIKALLLEKWRAGSHVSDFEYTTYGVSDVIELILQAQAAPQWTKLDKGNLWSFLRRVLEQGGAIEMDYRAGKYNSYEEYSARQDEAARERVEELFEREE